MILKRIELNPSLIKLMKIRDLVKNNDLGIKFEILSTAINLLLLLSSNSLNINWIFVTSNNDFYREILYKNRENPSLIISVF